MLYISLDLEQDVVPGGTVHPQSQLGSVLELGLVYNVHTANPHFTCGHSNQSFNQVEAPSDVFPYSSPLPPEIPLSSHPTIRVRRCQ